MHCYIYELSSKPVQNTCGRLSCDLPEWFFGSVADSLCDLYDKEHEWAKQRFFECFQNTCWTDCDGALHFKDNVKTEYFKNGYIEFQQAAALLSTATFEEFSGQKRSGMLDQTLTTLNSVYYDKFGHYIYLHDTKVKLHSFLQAMLSVPQKQIFWMLAMIFLRLSSRWGIMGVTPVRATPSCGRSCRTMQ